MQPDHALHDVVPGLQSRLLVELVQISNIGENSLEGVVPLGEFILKVNIPRILGDTLQVLGSGALEEQSEDG